MTSSQAPIGDAVTTAFGKSDVQNLDPNLVAQITENVIKQLRLVDLQAAPPQTQHSTTAAQPSPLPEPPTDKSTSYQPPTVSDPDPELDGESEPPTLNDIKLDISSGNKHDAPDSPEVLPSKDSTGNVTADAPHDVTSVEEETTLDKIWGALFDAQWQPTARLHQVLRGLAVHIIEDYEPRNSLVVTPTKMVKYYRAAKVEREIYPWHVLFDDEDTYISRMLREVGCQHHLVQESPFERPDLPGLTPAGFARWMVLMISAHPDEEFDRLRHSVVHHPIRNPDDRSERYPRDISRRLFPETANVAIRNDLRRAMAKHARRAGIEPPEDEQPSGFGNATQADSFASDSFGAFPPRHVGSGGARSDGSETLPAPALERERQPYRGSGSQQPPLASSIDRVNSLGSTGENAIMDDDSTAPSRPIERERQPYYANHGHGRVLEEPAGTRDVYQTQAPSGVVNSVMNAPSIGVSTTVKSYPPPLRQSSVGPAPAQAGVRRSNSGRATGGRAPGQGHSRNISIERGPPPAPSAGSASTASLLPEIHQQQPPAFQTRSRHGSFTRRRAGSNSRTYIPADGSAGVPQASYDLHKPLYVERAGGTDGYGQYEDVSGGRARGGSTGQASLRADYNAGRRHGSVERQRASPVKRERTTRPDSPGRHSWTGPDTYRLG